MDQDGGSKFDQMKNEAEKKLDKFKNSKDDLGKEVGKKVD